MSARAVAHHKETDRIALLQSVVLVVFAVIGYQLFVNSVVVHPNVLAAAKRQQITRQDIEPKRGTIYAKNIDALYPLASTEVKYDISAVPKNVKDKQKTAEFLATALGLAKDDVFNQINNDKLYISPFKKNVDRDIAQKIIDANYPGVLVSPQYVRTYLEGDLAAHVLGFVNFEGKGKYGIEGFYDEELHGYAGTVEGEQDRKGRIISVDSKNSAQDGDSLVLTIDHNVQFVAEQKLRGAIEEFQAVSGQVIIVDVKTGGIVALAGSPSFNPNTFNEVKPEDQKNFLDPVIGSIYEPGSIFKPLIVAAGLDAGKITPETEGDFGSSVRVGDYEIHTAEDKAFGHENVTEILEHSDNVAMVWLAEQTGSDVLYDYLQKFGFGTKMGIDVDGETTGKLLDKKLWRDIQRATISFGQGISVTPLQMVMAYQAIGNNGKLMKPHIVDAVIKTDGTKKEIDISTKFIRDVIKPETAEQVRKMLISVVDYGHGKRAAVPGYKIGGKTGTAQIPKSDGKGYEEDAHVGSFAGLVPADNPRFAMLVKLDRPSTVKFAESSAAPTFGAIASFLLQYYQVPKTVE